MRSKESSACSVDCPTNSPSAVTNRATTCLTFLLNSEIDDEPLTEEEILKICFLQLIGGVDTSTGLLSHTYAWLSEHPDERQRLLDDPEALKRATEEFSAVGVTGSGACPNRHGRDRTRRPAAVPRRSTAVVVGFGEPGR